MSPAPLELVSSAWERDYIDLLQKHRLNTETPIDETLGVLNDLVAAGKVRYIGSSNLSGWQIAVADWAARSSHRTQFVWAHNRYDLLERNTEHEVLPACEWFDLGMSPLFPPASGSLTGK